MMISEVIIYKILGCGLLMMCGALIKILTDYMQNTPVQKKYPPIRLFLSFIIGMIVGRSLYIKGYEPFMDYRAFLGIVAIGISLDLILKDLPKNIYNLLGKIRNAIIAKEIPGITVTKMEKKKEFEDKPSK